MQGGVTLPKLGAGEGGSALDATGGIEGHHGKQKALPPGGGSAALHWVACLWLTVGCCILYAYGTHGWVLHTEHTCHDTKPGCAVCTGARGLTSVVLRSRHS